MQHTYEIEIKSLLGGKDKADDLVNRMKQKDPNLKVLGSHRQLNHYFAPVPSGTGQVGGDLKSLYEKVQNLLDDASRSKLKDLAERAKAKSRTGAQATGTGNFSVRTRETDGKTAPHTGAQATGVGVILVVKATVDDTTSSNGTARLEWESVLFPSPGYGEGLREGLIRNIDDLDKLVLSSGFQYQAKWSRERSEYKYTPLPFLSPSPLRGEGGGEGEQLKLMVAIDKNAGYGYLAEFEMVVDDEKKADDAKNLIRTVMGGLKIDELPQDRLERMFKFYNENWKDYYGTEKTFTVE
ncbi:MAG: hypothetical protein AAB410_01635 [Patescibacteria group bacterium]